MKSSPIILIAGSVVSFLVIFIIMSFAMGLMSSGPGAFIAALMGHVPAAADSAAAAPHADGGLAASPEPSGEHESAHGGEIPSRESHDMDSPLVAGELPATPVSAEDGPEFLSRAEALARIEEALAK